MTRAQPPAFPRNPRGRLGFPGQPKGKADDGIPVELFQILKDDAVKVLHSICQQIWKTQQWPQDWKRSVCIPMPKEGNAKKCSNYCTIALISHASKIMLKILQASLAFELWCWRRLLRVPWTARRSNQSIQKEISPEYSLEGPPPGSSLPALV